MKFANFVPNIFKIWLWLQYQWRDLLFSVPYICCFVLHTIFFVFWQFTISNIFYSLCILPSSLSKISIGSYSSKTWLGNALSSAKCSFHRWKMDVKPVFLMCWEISNLYPLLSIILIIFHGPAFFELNNFFDNFFKAKYFAST